MCTSIDKIYHVMVIIPVPFCLIYFFISGNISKLHKDAPFINRYVVWSTAVSTICYGKWVRQICIFGVRDLPKLYKTRQLFVNKFHQFYQPLALDCLEELIYNRTRDEYIHKTKTKTSYYENLDFVKNAIK